MNVHAAIASRPVGTIRVDLVRRLSSGDRQIHDLRKRGVAAVELAIVLPVLVIVVFGCVDLGQFGSMWVALTNAVRSGAEYGVYHKVTETTEQQWELGIHNSVIEEMAETAGFEQESLNISVVVTSNPDGSQRVVVEGHYEFTPVINCYGLPETFSLRRQSSMCVHP